MAENSWYEEIESLSPYVLGQKAGMGRKYNFFSSPPQDDNFLKVKSWYDSWLQL